MNDQIDSLVSVTAESTVVAFRGGVESAGELTPVGSEDRSPVLEFPSNILLSSPDLRRIHALADRFDFIVACDDTVAGFVNLDAIPCVDVMISSLTKTFSGSSNVTGGSLVVNPSSRQRDTIKAALSANYEETYFPLDILTLINNRKNMPCRVKRFNESTIPLVNLLSSHQSIATVHHPSTAPTSSLYQSVMRKDGGYGNVMSIISVTRPAPNIPTISSIENVQKYGVPQRILRISVGLENSDQLLATVAKALKEGELFELQNTA
ncbi:hypothetical protein PENNAL_c0091G04427 [Penicillium nalgiovense]|uniref:Cystathionine gamma-synthase n=1 Tax=Penicillium nalgiovense TaxID=60175 RepID=A0A1V6XD02_PENNA|nr:hypothetical protein PENNAL_c0091G04427 [Penicillium nalgiovense]